MSTIEDIEAMSKVKCQCGSEILLKNMPVHSKTKKHIKKMHELYPDNPLYKLDNEKKDEIRREELGYKPCEKIGDKLLSAIKDCEIEGTLVGEKLVKRRIGATIKEENEDDDCENEHCDEGLQDGDDMDVILTEIDSLHTRFDELESMLEHLLKIISKSK